MLQPSSNLGPRESSVQRTLSETLGRSEPQQRLTDLTELFVQARQEPDLADALRQRSAELWTPPTDTEANLIRYFERLSEHCPPPESLDWYFQTFGDHLSLEGMNIGGARMALRTLLDRKPELADEAARKLLRPDPEQGFSAAQMVGLQDLVTSRRWTPEPEQMAMLTGRLEENLTRGPLTSGPHYQENQYLTALLVDVKKAHPEAVEPGLGRTLLGHLLEDPERRLYTVYGLEPPNQGFKSQSTYALAFPDPALEGELLAQLETGLATPKSHDLLMVLAGSQDYTGGAERLARHLESDVQRRHEPEYVDRILDHVVLHWLEQKPDSLEQAAEQRTALAHRWHAMQGRLAPLDPSLRPHGLTVEPEWVEGLSSQADTLAGQARVVLAHEAGLTEPLLAELQPWLERGVAPTWPPAANAFRELKTEDFRRRLPDDYSALLRGFRPVALSLGTETWLEVASSRFQPELARLAPLMEGLPTTIQANMLERFADCPHAIADLTGLGDLEAEQRPAAVAQLLNAPIPTHFFPRLLEVSPDNLELCLSAHHDMTRRVEAGLDPEVAFQQVTAPLVFGGRLAEAAGIGMHEGYLVVGGNRLRPRDLI